VVAYLSNRHDFGGDVFSRTKGSTKEVIMDFPKCVSFTITNACNLRCKMCGQWSEEGYMHNRKARLREEMALEDWKRLVDELAAHKVGWVLLRGGEPFLYPGIIDLLEYIHGQGIFISIDTNGTMLKSHAAELVRIGDMHLTISVDGPEEIHDYVRSVKGCFQRLREGIESLHALEKGAEKKISKSICLTISPYSYRGLGELPNVARSLSIESINIVPYYYVPEDVGKLYESEMEEHLGCRAYSWRGFHHETSGVDGDEFEKQYERYMANLGDIENFPYMVLSIEEYRTWFEDATTQVGPKRCINVEKLIDIQPNGDANFCVDFPDYVMGSVKEATIEELWNDERAQRFRDYRRKKPLAVCYRCGAKYMSEIGD
jgi:MoaA/NifB/PqqE/SkfB family radical SAM enzyme